ncbi:GNAT family N-acetyltransferase [Bacillus marinisedimentorum]|uniref:GNAT family N-acetyltransferase n=1 Tax=Bacillus marinisedimentorum TaxID=1821260 RepID=UPI0007E0406C|nr:GNAT family N-acetyltransferase [Bacillus marinisedimentorum]
MNQYNFITDYKENAAYRKSFSDLASKTFGINFEAWYEKGYWDERYVCYSFIDGDKVISNVSANDMTLVIDGEEKKAVQLATVMTDPEYMGKGLAASLMNQVLTDYEKKGYDFIYLSANESVLDFYPRFGFERVDETLFILPADRTPSTRRKLRKLDLENDEDRDIILRLSANRRPASSLFGVKNDRHILLFYFLFVFGEDIYYAAEDDMIIVFEIEDGTLHLYDVLSIHPFSLKDVLAHTTGEDVKETVFHFTPDFSDDRMKKTADSSSMMFVKFSGGIRLPKEFRFPDMSQT